MRLIVLGGSAAATPELFDALVDWPGGTERRPPLEVVLVGRSVEKLELVARECRRRVTVAGGSRRAGPPIEVRAEPDRRRALQGADVVLNQVRVGGLAGRAFDETFPRAFGLPGEETMGPGGFADAVRTVPALRPTWDDVARIAPTALVVDLTNPAGIVVAAARREYALNVLSVCDSPLSHTGAIAERLGRPVGRVRARYLGMNHVGWYVPESPDELPGLADLAVGQDAADVLIDGAVAAPYVRYYTHPDRMQAGQAGTATRAEELRGLEGELLTAFADGREGAQRRGAAWYGLGVVPLLDAWRNGTTETLILGLFDGTDGEAGALSGVVTELSVAVPAPADLRPAPAVTLPPGPADLLAAHAAYERRTVDAILAGATRARLTEALTVNPMVRDDALAARLVEAILAGSPSGAAA
jgi:6-phospho-beta-glucosidase